MVDSRKPEARNCLLYLVSPPVVDIASFTLQLEAALTAAKRRVGAFLLDLETQDHEEIARIAQVLRLTCGEHRVAFLLSERAGLANELNLDGVHVSDPESAKRTRGAIDESMVLGVECGNSQDSAMRVGEQGADYVVFDAFTDADEGAACLDNLEWWQHYFVLPCAAMGGITPENCAPFVKAGADFLIVSSAVWEHPAGAAEAVKSFDAVIREALQTA